MDVKQHASSKTRRQKRKDERKLKKLRRDCFCRRKTIPTQESLEAEELERQKQEMLRRQKIKDKLQQKEERREMEKAAEEAEEEKKKQLEIINKEDHKTLRELERKLKIKPKLNSWPSAFKNDHLDYILNYKDEAELLKSYVESGKDKKSRKRLHSSDEEENSLTSDEENVSLDGSDEDSDSKKEETDDDSETRGSDAGSDMDIAVDDDEDDDEEGDDDDDDDGEADKTEEDEEASEDDDSSDNDDDNEGEEMLKGKVASKKPAEAVKGILNEKKSTKGKHEKKTVSFGEKAEEEEPKRKRSDVLTEDIYGRLRDKEGNVVKDDSKAFVPRGRRLQQQQQQQQGDGEGMETLKMQISRIINRLHDKQMQMFSSQMENLFVSHSRANASEALTTELIKDSIKNELIKRNRAMDSMLLLAILHSKVGNEVSAVFLEALVAKFDEMFKTMDDSDGTESENQFENTVLLVTHLYQFKVVDCHLVYSIIEKLVSRFFVKDIHLLTLIWKEIGFCLRKDNPKVFQSVYLKTTEMVSTVDKKYAHKRVLSMQLSDILLAVKSNNPKKLVKDDEEELESRQKLLKTILSDSVNVPLHVSLDDLLSSDQKGKWWLVGSAWAGSADSAALKHDVDEKTTDSVPQAGDVNLMKLAQKLHMNTDVRKKILFAVVTSNNYREAFERVMKLSLTRRQDKDVIHVISTLCKRGKGNPFYTHLAETFRKYHRRFKKLPGISESRSTEEEMDFNL